MHRRRSERRPGYRFWTALVGVAACSSVVLFGSCDNTEPSARPTGGTATGSTASTTLTAGTADPYADDRVVTLGCAQAVGVNADLSDMDEPMLGVVALPTRRAFRLPPGGHFMKHGLVVQPGAQFDLIVPVEFRGRASLQWGAPGEETTHLRVNGCTATMTTSPIRDVMTAPAPGGQPAPWVAFAGGYIVDQPTCLPLIVKTATEAQTVHVGVGVTCPGQEPPPPEPTDFAGQTGTCQANTSTVGNGKPVTVAYDGRVALYNYDPAVGMPLRVEGYPTKILWLVKAAAGTSVALRANDVLTNETVRWETPSGNGDVYDATTQPGLPFDPAGSTGDVDFGSPWSSVPSNLNVAAPGTIEVRVNLPDGVSTMCVRFVKGS